MLHYHCTTITLLYTTQLCTTIQDPNVLHVHTLHCILHVLHTATTQVVDIGGGLAANMKTPLVTPAFQQYAAALCTAASTLMHAAPHGRQLITEFGRALIAKTAFTASVVEYVRKHEAADTSTVCTFASAPCGSLQQQPECSNDSNAVATGGVEQATAAAANATANDESDSTSTDGSSGVRTLILHAGADLFPREVYTNAL
jgi:hypothetical protein